MMKDNDIFFSTQFLTYSVTPEVAGMTGSALPKFLEARAGDQNGYERSKALGLKMTFSSPPLGPPDFDCLGTYPRNVRPYREAHGIDFWTGRRLDVCSQRPPETIIWLLLPTGAMKMQSWTEQSRFGPRPLKSIRSRISLMCVRVITGGGSQRFYRNAEAVDY